MNAATFFDAIAGRYDRAYAPERHASRRRMRRVLDELSTVGAALDVLDLGVGTGRELSALQDAGHRVVGVDISERMLDLCRRRTRPVPLVEADMWSGLPMIRERFDAAIALHGTLAHAPSDAAYATLRDTLDRLLRPEAVFIAEVPDQAWLEQIGPIGSRFVHGEGVAERTAKDACVYEDRVTSARIEARFHDEAWWSRALSGAFVVHVRRLEEDELFVVARRAASAPT